MAKKIEKTKVKKLSGVTNYHVGDFLIQVKNAAMAGNKQIEFRKTNMVLGTARALKDAKFLDEISEKDGIITATLTYKHKRPLLVDLKLVSKPGLRVYINALELSKRRKPSLLILSTSKGILTGKKALKENAGGEVLAEIW